MRAYVHSAETACRPMQEASALRKDDEARCDPWSSSYRFQRPSDLYHAQSDTLWNI